ncbi:MAG: hypothetical protein E7583_06200 [Ruminococcaceae bacterium]|nr:hypothetical protein [Oscillospiraceae bacterium]
MKKICMRLFIPLLIAFITISSVSTTPDVELKVEAATLNQQKNQLGVLKDKYNDSAKKAKKVREDLAKNKDVEKTTLQRKDELELEIRFLTEQIENAKFLIAEYEASISEKQNERVELEKKRNQQIDTLGEMIRTSYMYGDESYIDLILGSKDISDFLQRLDFISYHMDYSGTLIEEIEATAASLDEVTAYLSTTLEAMDSLKLELEAVKAEREPILAEVDAIMEELKADEEYMRNQLAIEERDTAALEKDIKALEKQIAEKEAQLKKEEEAKKKAEGQKNNGKGDSGSKTGGGNGSLAWPLGSRKPQSSSYGYRKDPFTGKTSFHNGLDIPAPHGTHIYAAASGTVTRASRYDTYGECVIIDHGGGMITLYAHCSGYNVKVGQKVNQGDVIAYVGSTGRSTGNHLHFVVRINGQYKDPNHYLP